MSAAETESPAPVTFSVPVPEVDHTHDVIPFNLDDDPDTVLVAHRPKRATMRAIITAAAVLDSAVDEDHEAAIAYERLLAEVLDEPSLKYLNDRFNDKEDDLDLDVVTPIMRELIGVWFGGPTGSPRGPAPSRKRSGGRSTGRARSKGSTR